MWRDLNIVRRIGEPLDALTDMHARQRAFRNNVFVPRLGGLSRDGLADFQRNVEIILHNAPRPAMAGAALDDLNVSVRQEPKKFSSFLAHVLRARMTGDMDGDATLDGGEALA